jgi:predicted dithiol-disulfide oxidoreductase (DUF899 family)
LAVIILDERGRPCRTDSRKQSLEILEKATRRYYRVGPGWNFKWLSSFGNEFNRDHHVSFTPEEMAQGKMYYNYGMTSYPMEEAHGLSVFTRDKSGDVFHTYSCYARGLDLLLGAYNFLDLVPKGRDEGGLGFSMEWIRHHDRYGR